MDDRSEQDRVVKAGVLAMDEALWSGDLQTAMALCDQLTRYVELHVSTAEARDHLARERERLAPQVMKTLDTAVKVMDETLWTGDVANAERVYQHLLGYLDRHLPALPDLLTRWRREHGLDPQTIDLSNPPTAD